MNNIINKVLGIGVLGAFIVFGILTFIISIFILFYAIGPNRDDVAFFGNDEYVISKVNTEYELFKNEEIILKEVADYKQKDSLAYILGKEQYVIIDEKNKKHKIKSTAEATEQEKIFLQNIKKLNSYKELY
ncbi:hypothetical protein [Domibacillus aminovorans]|uniref:Uncharacterized protein n=1 Tax=Domibacillus aminovorans TaxID=29332 RepID=A0A177L332_9BACI|nr:hypothetical protein [Domibacillus aminovorans]OAH59171.1 hypothetical protein AWH49_18665 [Domibacillus aminovorans]